MQQADEFKQESDALHAVLEPLPDAAYAVPTQFNGWTINDVIQHLHHFNVLAGVSLNDPKRFAEEYEAVRAMRQVAGIVATSNEFLGGLKGRELLGAWRGGYEQLAHEFSRADPKQRLKWAGPDMSARSSITARMMETWAHGQEVFDRLGVERQNADRIRNIAHLGYNTFGWTFANRGELVPGIKPYVELEAPSGAIWKFGEPQQTERITGDAVGFCQVVCQTRNVSDTNLSVVGPVANQWMATAQCFAGPPKDPPAPGVRGRDPVGIALDSISG